MELPSLHISIKWYCVGVINKHEIKMARAGVKVQTNGVQLLRRLFIKLFRNYCCFTLLLFVGHVISEEQRS